MRQSQPVKAGSFPRRVGSVALLLFAAGLSGASYSWAQAPPPPSETAPPPPSSRSAPPPRSKAESKTKAEASTLRQVGDLTTRFRFIERYTSAEPGARPTDIGLYRAGARATHRVVTERPQGAPDRRESTTQIIYTERPSIVDSAGLVTDTVRRYDVFKITSPSENLPTLQDSLDGLTVWYKSRPGSFPFLMSLTEGRRLTEKDYEYTAHQIFLPDLSTVLPTAPTRVDDRWPLTKEAQRVLFGYRPSQPSTIYAKLQDVQKSPKGRGYAAVIAVTGKAKLPPSDAESTLNAQLVFSFPALPTAAGEGDVMEVPGAITNLRLALTSTSFAPNSKRRLLSTHTNELTMERQLEPIGATPLAVPAAPPAPTKENSWLTYDDPDGRFHFRHPQDYLPSKEMAADSENADAVILRDFPTNRAPASIIRFELIPKTGNAEADRNNRDPEFYIQQLKETWAEAKAKVVQGPTGWLPEADWKSFNMKVFAIRAALKVGNETARNDSRVFYDRFIVLFTRNECLVVTATTPKDPPTAFRNEIEEILKSFKLEPAKKAAGS
jgi:hypothetical protein